MFFSGFADEAAVDIDTQIRAHKEIGQFDFIEPRLVDGVQVTKLEDSVFDAVVDKLQTAGIGISCYGSAIANWARDIDGDFSEDVEDLKRNIPRMQRTNTPFIRVMSWANRNDVPVATWRSEAIRRMRELAKIAADGGVVLAHENCTGWGGLSPDNSLELVEEVNSPAFKLIFDTGNVSIHNHDGPSFLKKVRDHVVYVHIKDYHAGTGTDRATFAGEGSCGVRESITYLFQTGYDGGFSIEPHIKAVVHAGKTADSEADSYDTYVEDGKRFKALAEECRWQAEN